MGIKNVEQGGCDSGDTKGEEDSKKEMGWKGKWKGTNKGENVRKKEEER